MNRKDRDDQEFFEANKEEDEQKKTYYSYGPFPSGQSPSERSVHSVSITEPQQTTSYVTDEQDESMRGWTYPRKRRSNWKSSFVAFMAGVLVISSLMFAADYFNWFTSGTDAMPAIQESYTSGNQSGTSSGSGFQNASIQVTQPETVADIAEQSNPAVVLVETYGSARSNMSQDDIFRFFFGSPRSESPGGQGEKVKTGAGSGFIFDQAGYILTNEHVVSGADEIEVTVLGHKEPYEAELLGYDFDLDLAVLKIKGDGKFPVLPFGDSSEMRPGDWVTAIGNPQGFNHSVSVGVLSAVEREIQVMDQAQQKTRMYDHLLQTDAAINPGNSGGPLINLKGEVIGINTAVSTQAQGIGFAIPSSTVVQVLDRLKSGEPIPKPYIGVELHDINESWLSELKLDSTKGSIVMSVFGDSPASRSGLQPYDVILEVNEQQIENTQQLIDKINETDIGERLDLTISRNGQTMQKAITIGDRNA